MANDSTNILSACGRKVGPEQIRHAQKVVQMCSGLSHHELAFTLCEHWGWVGATGKSSTTAASCCFRGCVCRIWQVMFWDNWLVRFERTGRHGGTTNRCCWRRSWTRRAIAGSAIERGAGRCWASEALRERELTQGLERATNPSVPNRISGHTNVEQERTEREEVTAQFIDSIRPQLPALLTSLSEIDDYRNPKKIEHQLTMVLLYGILCFLLLHTSSRREANRELTGPVLLEHLRELFPEMKSIPHQDTLNRILARIEVEQLQQAHLQMLRRLIRNTMKGYHYLMHLGHAFNVLAQYSEHLFAVVAAKGVGAFIKYVRESLVHPWFDPRRLHERLRPKPQLRLV